MAIYHQYHEKATNKPSITDWESVCDEIFAGTRSPVINDENWGLGNHTLDEHVLEFL
jgi:hypothetical protein